MVINQTSGVRKASGVLRYNRIGMQSIFRKQVALPQDHGSWVLILSPLAVGVFTVNKTFSTASIFLIAGALTAFLLRQPVTMLVKVYAGRRPRTDLPAARFWIIAYGLGILAALAGLISNGYLYVISLAVPGIPIFAWHLWLIGRRAERRQAGVEIVATGVLALAAPAAYWTGAASYDPRGWWLWLLTWLQSAASIVHAYLRLAQREPAQGPARGESWKMGRRALAYTSFNLAFSLALGLVNWLPRWIFVPFLVQWLETLWGITRPAAGWKPIHIGIRQSIVSTLWTILFVLCWRLG